VVPRAGLVWTGAENLAPTGILSPDRRACSQSLYQLRYLHVIYDLHEILVVSFCRQAGRLWVQFLKMSLEFFYIILLAALWPWG